MFLWGATVVCLAMVHLRHIDGGKIDVTAEAQRKVLEALNLDRRDVEAIGVPLITFPEQSEESIARNGRAMRIRAFNGDYSLYLHPRHPVLISDETPVYYVKPNVNKSGGYEYELIENAMKKVGQLLEDPRHRASVVLNTDESNDRTVTAVVTPENSTSSVVIKTVERRSINHRDDYSSNSKDYVAVQLKNEVLAKYAGKVRAKRDAPQNEESHDSADAQPNHPSALYPKLLLAIDSYFYKNSSDAALVQTLEYFMALINGVDLSYRHLENPTVNLHIAAITIATTPAPYVENNLKYRGRGWLKSRVIPDMKTYFHHVKNQIPVKYDIVLSFGKALGPVREGSSSHKPVCGNSSDQHVGAVAHVSDNSRFSAIEYAVIVLANIFGLDFEKIMNISPGCRTSSYQPVDADCENGTMSIMTLSFRERSGATFSEKSLRELNRLLANGDFKCMYERPAIKGNVLPELMPGKMMSLLEQCTQPGFLYGPDSKDEYTICGSLSCTDRNSTGHATRKLTHPYPPAPGTPCKRHDSPNPGVCLEKRCVGL